MEREGISKLQMRLNDPIAAARTGYCPTEPTKD